MANFWLEVFVSTIEFVFTAACVVAGVFVGIKLRRMKNAKESR